jgi:hypothetical protein
MSLTQIIAGDQRPIRQNTNPAAEKNIPEKTATSTATDGVSSGACMSENRLMPEVICIKSGNQNSDTKWASVPWLLLGCGWVLWLVRCGIAVLELRCFLHSNQTMTQAASTVASAILRSIDQVIPTFAMLMLSTAFFVFVRLRQGKPSA